MAFDDLLALFKKENWRYSTLVLWLLSGLSFLAFSSFPIMVIIGIFILLPLLAFLMFLFLLSLFSKKPLEEYSDKKVIIFMFLSLPIMLILSIILFIIFIFAIILYFFFTSWFIIYGSYLTGRSVDKSLKNHSYSKFTRGLELFGGVTLSILLIVGSLIGIVLFNYYGTFSPIIRNFLFAVFTTVGACIVVLTIVGLYYYKQGDNNSWLGIFFVLIIIYTFYLVAKLFLGLTSGGQSNSSIPTKAALLVIDLFIILYSISTIWGSQADLLSEKVKYFGTDTVLIGLLFSKVSYEFAVNFPFNYLKQIPIFTNFPYIDQIVNIGSNLSLGRNITVLVFIVLLLIIIGVYEIRKHSKIEEGTLVDGLIPQDTEEKEGEKEEINEEDEMSDSEEFEKSEDDKNLIIEEELGENILDSNPKNKSNLKESEDDDKATNFENQ
jgi:hypothetical protein